MNNLELMLRDAVCSKCGKVYTVQVIASGNPDFSSWCCSKCTNAEKSVVNPKGVDKAVKEGNQPNFEGVLDYDHILKYYNLKNLVRYNQRFRLKDESVAEHSYYVSLFTMMICDKLQVSSSIKNDSLTWALIHDLPEIYTSDIPHPTKVGNPGMEDFLVRVEHKVMEEHFSPYHELYKKITTGNYELVDCIVKLADIVSVIQYTTLEIRLGNKTMIEVLDNALDRYRTCLVRLQKMTGVKVDIFES